MNVYNCIKKQILEKMSMSTPVMNLFIYIIHYTLYIIYYLKLFIKKVIINYLRINFITIIINNY